MLKRSHAIKQTLTDAFVLIGYVNRFKDIDLQLMLNLVTYILLYCNTTTELKNIYNIKVHKGLSDICIWVL